jgi:hypothetical protein
MPAKGYGSSGTSAECEAIDIEMIVCAGEIVLSNLEGVISNEIRTM